VADNVEQTSRNELGDVVASDEKHQSECELICQATNIWTENDPAKQNTQQEENDQTDQIKRSPQFPIDDCSRLSNQSNIAPIEWTDLSPPQINDRIDVLFDICANVSNVIISLFIDDGRYVITIQPFRQG
jgi:hypothetical protein